MQIRRRERLKLWSLFLLSLLFLYSFSKMDEKGSTRINVVKDTIKNPLKYIYTSFENASPLNWELDSNGTVVIGLIYDHERSSPNRATGHWHFQVQAKAGSDLTFVLKNFDNIWNGMKADHISDRTNCYISQDGKKWTAIPTELISDNRLSFKLHMEGDKMYVAGVEPYRPRDLENLIREIGNNPLVKISPIGKTVEGRQLEIIRVGYPNAPYRVFIRARAHGFEAGGNWVVQGLIRSLLQKDAAKHLKKYCVYILPMANKDAVAAGRTRFNSMGVDLNRKWDKPANPNYAPENYALESWLEGMIRKGKKPDLAIDLHNDRGGNLHIYRPNFNLTKYLENMKRLGSLLHRYTWFREQITGADPINPESGDEFIFSRYNIDACVYELNFEWIEGLKKVPFGRDWQLLGNQLREVFYDYFDEKK